PSLQVAKVSRQACLAAARVLFADCTHERRSVGVDRSRQTLRAVEKSSAAVPRQLCLATRQAVRQGFAALAVPATGTTAIPIASPTPVRHLVFIPSSLALPRGEAMLGTRAFQT